MTNRKGVAAVFATGKDISGMVWALSKCICPYACTGDSSLGQVLGLATMKAANPMIAADDVTTLYWKAAPMET